MIDLTRRSTEPELLDEGVDEAEARAGLADLRFVNRFLGGRRALRRALRGVLDGAPSSRLLDVGCGSADLPAMLMADLPGLSATGVDSKHVHLRFAPASVNRVVADVRALPFARESFDVVTASLFLHHFDAHEAPLVLGRLFALARRALVVNDLRRAHVPYYFGRLVFPWLFQSRVSVLDGLISIRRSFTTDELRAAFRDAGIEKVSVARVFPYRLLAVARK